jgi:hypothetical protein
VRTGPNAGRVLLEETQIVVGGNPGEQIRRVVDLGSDFGPARAKSPYETSSVEQQVQLCFGRSIRLPSDVSFDDGP